MSYGQNLHEHYRRAAYYVDRILHGARPRELPIEQATKFQYIVNLRAARELGIALPQQLLVQATRVLQ